MEFPRNPLHKPGYTLEFNDDFDGPAIDGGQWIAAHLPQWSSRAQAAARSTLRDSTLVLRIDADQPPWCPEYDGAIRCSSLQTGVHSGPLGSPIGQHRFNPASVVREEQPRRLLYTPTFGYFEMRARGTPAHGSHAALWMIGVEDEPQRSAEICVCELFGKHAGSRSSTVCFGVHPFNDPAVADDFRQLELPIALTDFHVYAAEWHPTHVDFFIDNEHVGTVNQSPQYPMQLMLGLYERPAETPPTPAGAPSPHPKTFVVDYVRGYRRHG